MKKVLKVIGIILGVLIILGLIFFVVDYNRVKNNERPIFCIHNPAGAMNDGGTVEFFGLGYKVIDFRTLAGFDDIKIGTWFMDYNDFNEEMKVYEKKFEEKLQKNDYNIENNVFNARIKEIREYNGITTILIEVSNVEKIHDALKTSGYKIAFDIEENWYRQDNKLLGNKEFLIQDPDGYLLRFSEDLGEK